MPKVTEEYRDARRREIADAALRAFRRKGFQGATMADIIAESGLSAGAIYGHFAGKSEIVYEVGLRIVGARTSDYERLMASDPLPPPSHLTRVLMRGMLDDFGDPTILVQLWGEAITDPQLHGLATEVFSRLRAMHIRYISLWQQREHGLSPTAADAIAQEQVSLFVSAAQGFMVQSALMPDFDRERYLQSLEKYLPH